MIMTKILSSISRDRSTHGWKNIRWNIAHNDDSNTRNNQLNKYSPLCTFLRIITLVVQEQPIKFKFILLLRIHGSISLYIFSIMVWSWRTCFSLRSECCDMNVLFLSVNVNVFDCVVCVCVLVFSFPSLTHSCCHSSLRSNCARLRHNTYQHPDSDRFFNLNSRKFNISGLRSRMMLFPARF